MLLDKGSAEKPYTQNVTPLTHGQEFSSAKKGTSYYLAILKAPYLFAVSVLKVQYLLASVLKALHLLAVSILKVQHLLASSPPKFLQGPQECLKSPQIPTRPCLGVVVT